MEAPRGGAGIEMQAMPGSCSASGEAPRGGAGIEIKHGGHTYWKKPEAPRGGAGIEILMYPEVEHERKKPLAEGLVLKYGQVLRL